MSASALPRMTADEFIAWAMLQPETEHYELVAGEVVVMSAERVTHVRAKQQIWRRLDEAITAAALLCEAFVDGLSVQVDEATVYEPDVLVRCGPRLPPETVRVHDPLIIVEVRSPSSAARDAGAKLEDYFRIPTLRHYLIVKTENNTIIHHVRDAAGDIATRIVRDGTLTLDPPGITVRDLFVA